MCVFSIRQFFRRLPSNETTPVVEDLMIVVPSFTHRSLSQTNYDNDAGVHLPGSRLRQLWPYTCHKAAIFAACGQHMLKNMLSPLEDSYLLEGGRGEVVSEHPLHIPVNFLNVVSIDGYKYLSSISG